jgi:AcrR family transcriptional regulator
MHNNSSIETFSSVLESLDEGFFRFGVRIMNAGATIALEPRKTPVQARAAVTVGAISEAAIQVLLSHGADRLTTTRVAERAGVSVGTLYQYFPNKRSLLFAVFEDHLDKVTKAVESACWRAHRQPLAQMIRQVVEAFVDAKIERADISVAFYQISMELGGAALVKKTGQRVRKAIELMLQTAPDLKSSPDRVAIDVMCSAMAGAMRYALESEAPPATMRRMREQLVVLCQSYLAAIAT